MEKINKGRENHSKKPFDISNVSQEEKIINESITEKVFVGAKEKYGIGTRFTEA